MKMIVIKNIVVVNMSTMNKIKSNLGVIFWFRIPTAIQMTGLNSRSTSDPSFLQIYTSRSSRWWLKCLDPCCTHGRPWPEFQAPSFDRAEFHQMQTLESKPIDKSVSVSLCFSTSQIKWKERCKAIFKNIISM